MKKPHCIVQLIDAAVYPKDKSNAKTDTNLRFVSVLLLFRLNVIFSRLTEYSGVCVGGDIGKFSLHLGRDVEGRDKLTNRGLGNSLICTSQSL